MQKRNLLLSLSLMLVLGSQTMAQWQLNGNAGTVPPTDFIGTTDNVALVFKTFNLERMRIGNAGQIGIGTPNPNANVHIRSAANQQPFRVDVLNAAGNGIVKLFTSNNGGTSIGGTGVAPVVPPANGLYVNGNTGIANTNPAARLHVNGAGGASAFRVDVANAAKLVVNANGSVSVGSNFTSPANSLFVQNDLEVAGGLINLGSVENLEDAGSYIISSNSHFVPTASCDLDLGTVDLPWRDIFLCNAPVVLSDGRFKSNVQELSYGLHDILKLRAVSYNLGMNPADKKKIGLIAQEVQKVIPEMVIDSKAVKDESTGKTTRLPASRLGLEYTALVPVLVKAIQEQHAVIASKEKQLTELETRFNELEATLVRKGIVSAAQTNAFSANGSLQQNHPNPFHQNTIIRYKIPAGANAQIFITDLKGRKVKTLQASESGQVQVNATDLQAGVYLYTLLVNGQTITSKKMVLLK